MTWQTIPIVNGEVHVVPDDDLRPHEQIRCWCQPTALDDEPAVIVHHAMDRREQHEQGAPLH